MPQFTKFIKKSVKIDLSAGDVLSYTDAARLLGLTLPGLKAMVYRGVFAELIDEEEPNPQRAGRLLRVEVEMELRKRRAERDARRSPLPAKAR